MTPDDNPPEEEEPPSRPTPIPSPPPVSVILGTGNIGSPHDPLVKNFSTVAAVQSCLDLVRRHHHTLPITRLDTARLYSPNVPGTCEVLLGQTDAPLWAAISSKVHAAPTLHRARILSEIDASLRLLGIPQLDICYLHGPDRATPWAEQCAAMDEAHQRGRFRRFGVSNLAPGEVEEVVGLCRREGWVVPTVYQGHYNAVSRAAEEELLPVLRRLGLSFYAYSPAAGGLFAGTGTGEPKERKQGGRWREEGRIGDVHRSWYHSDAVIQAAYQISKRAERAGISGHAAVLRWLMHHSSLGGEYHGDAIILGGSSLEQVEANLEACAAGPLPVDLVSLIDAAWEVARESPPPAWV